MRTTGDATSGRERKGGRWQLVVGAVMVAMVVAACTTTAPTRIPPGPGPLTPFGKGTLTEVKRSHYGKLAEEEAIRIGYGTAQPAVEFTVEDSPPSIFVNWAIPDDRAADFADAVDLPPGFSLAKVKILETDPVAKYWVSLNIYRVSGLTTGLRAEWSTYVDDGGDAPRFMIVRARAAEGSLDPIGPLAPPEPFSHTVDAGGTIVTSMKKTVLQNGVPVLTSDPYFSSTIGLPAPAERNFVVPAREWVAANDFIYWLNGVNDRVFHNSTSNNAPLISVDLGDVTLDDDSEFAQFVDPAPDHVLAYLGEIQFVISPWWNVTELDGRVAPATVANLSSLKKQIYSGLAGVTALDVKSGTAEPSVQSTREGDPPAAHLHWRIPDERLEDFRAAAGLPPALDLAEVRLQEDDLDADHWLTLDIHRRTGDNAGVRAEWTTYVDDGSGIRTLVLESRSSGPGLDPVNLFTQPYPVSLDLAADTLTASVGTGADELWTSFAVPPAGSATTVLATRDWVTTGDLRYWRNGVADRVFYDSTVLGPRVSIDPGSVALTYAGEWSSFVGPSVDRVWVDRVGVDQVINPWWNLKGL
jgi:hypothetical protein